MKITYQKTDLRVKRTHTLLWRALEELLTQQGQSFSTITVNQICEKAMVHRTTFYKHFEDKYDLLSLGLSRSHDEFLKNNLKERVTKPFQTIDKINKESLLENMMLNQREDTHFQTYINQHMKDRLKLDFIELAESGTTFTVPIEIIAEFYSGVISSLCTWWFQNGKTVPAEQMDQYFHKMVNIEFFSV